MEILRDEVSTQEVESLLGFQWGMSDTIQFRSKLDLRLRLQPPIRSEGDTQILKGVASANGREDSASNGEGGSGQDTLFPLGLTLLGQRTTFRWIKSETT